MALHLGAPWPIVFLPVAVLFIAWQQQRHSCVSLSPLRSRLVLAFRIALVVLVTLALTQPVLVTQARSSTPVLLVDVSRSIGDRTLEATRALVRKHWQPGELEVVTFAGHARAARPDGDAPSLERHDGDATRVGEAIAFARGLAGDRAPHLVLVSDGHHDAGALEMARRARADGIRLDVLRPPGAPLVDARVTEVRLPETLRLHEPARASITIESTTAGNASLRFEENGFLVDERPVTLARGARSFEVDFDPSAAGLTRYRAQITLAGDELADNDRFTRPALVSGPPRVLIASSTAEEGEHLEAALSAQGIQVDSMSPSSLPTTLDGLLGYDEAVLAGVAPHELDRMRQGALAGFVRDAGGGLLFVSGRGGLRRDPDGRPGALEPLLPVELTAPSEKDEPPVALVLLIDRSGSMVGEKLQFAKQAALAVIDKLTPHDQLGVIAFDAKFDWVLPLGPVEDKDRVKAQVGALGAGGGTKFYPALEEAYFTLASADAAVRHAVLLTDGVSTDPDVFAPLLDKARAAGVTVSTVAIGRGADLKLLERIAKLGGGRYTLADRADQVPNIFIHETESVQREAAQRRDTRAMLVSTARELAGIELSTAPPLGGYVRTKSKVGAEPLVETDLHDPLLVRWRYGLGQVIAFTSDATAAWGARWLTWPGFGKLWAQLSRGVARPHRSSDLRLTLRTDEDRLTLMVDAIDPNGRFVDELETRVDVIDGAEHARDVELHQVAPGRYQGEIVVGAGNVLARPSALRAGRRYEGEWTVLARPYPAELMHTGVDQDALARLAQAGGGVVGGEELLSSTEAKGPRARPLAMPLTLFALLFFLADLTTRRARWELTT